MELLDLAKITVTTTQFSTLIPVVVALVCKYKGVRFGYLTPLFLILLLFIPMEILNSYLASLGNNVVFGNSMRILSTIFYSMVFFSYSEIAQFKRFIVFGLVILLAIVAIQIFLSPWELHFQISNLAQNLFLMLISFIVLLQLRMEKNLNTIDQPIFWYATTILFYNSSSIVVIFVQNYFIELSMNRELLIVYMIFLILNFAQYLLFSIVFVKQYRLKSFGNPNYL